jgi:hypothetical protein
MRASVLLVPVVLCVACHQELDHPDAAATCDPSVTKCVFTPPPAMGTDGNAGGDSSVGQETGTFSGSVVVFNDDYFDRGDAFTGMAKVSANGKSGGRVTANYDGTGFELDEVLKDRGNWFWVQPAAGTGALPTLIPIDTRTTKADRLTVGVVNALDVDNIFAFLNTERSMERAQVVLTLLDEDLRSVPSVSGKLNSEVTAYRAAGGWVGDNVTDDSGMIFFGNVQAGSALSSVSISLSGAVTTRIDVKVAAGAVTVVTAIVNP